jgi:3-ketosteroid 9alpha-monooxygenase subunit A
MSTSKHFSHSGFARGWFVVSFSNELTINEVKPIRYFGQDLVLFRTAGGEAKVLDAFCPHLGAHLGHGGVVEGDALRCPFHAWKFTGDGECVDAPYAKRTPPKARLGCWPVSEKNGVICVWHDKDKGAPDWELPDVETGSDDWSEWDTATVQIKTHPHAIAENVADAGHFPFVHRVHVTAFENSYEGHTATQSLEGIARPEVGAEEKFTNSATYHGPGFMVSEMWGLFHSMLLNMHTPIEENLVDLRVAARLKKTGMEKRVAKYAGVYIEGIRMGFFQDVRIWEHKRFVERPVLCDGDGPIMKLRQWYGQFYESRPLPS